MHFRSKLLAPVAGAIFALALSSISAAQAADLTVISGGAIEPGLKAAAAAFEKETGHKVAITFNTTPQMRKRIPAGDQFDVVIAPPVAIESFAKAGLVNTEGKVNVGRVGGGVAVRPGAPVPAMATKEDLKKVLLEADSVVFNRASSGLYLEKLFRQMGIWDKVSPKATRYATGAEVMQHILKGKGREIGFGPITEIMLEKSHGLVFVGPLPPEVQRFNDYIAVAMTKGTQKDVAMKFVTYLGGPVAKPLFQAAGIN
jgi:molybdate transport system substrate-binding protein